MEVQVDSTVEEKEGECGGSPMCLLFASVEERIQSVLMFSTRLPQLITFRTESDFFLGPLLGAR